MLISHRERLNEETPVHVTGDAIVRSASNQKMQNAAEMTASSQSIGRVTSVRIPFPHFTCTKSVPIGAPQFGVASELKRNARILSDGLEPCDGNKAEADRTLIGHRERLSERTSYMDDAIVCSHRNKNYEKSAEMTDSFRNGRVTKKWKSGFPVCRTEIWRRCSESCVVCAFSLVYGAVAELSVWC